MKFITNFLKRIFGKTEKNIENVDIKIEIWDPPKNVEIYQEIRKDHERNEVLEKPKKRKPAKPRVAKPKDIKEDNTKKPAKKKKTE